MVVGKLLILSISLPVAANELENPRFFEYSGGSFTNRLLDFSFGWFKTLDDEQKLAYNQALTQAVMYADNGQAVRWYKNDASGIVVPAMTFPAGSGYCRRIHIQTIAYGVRKATKANACYDISSSRWTWHSDKY
jgi:surface antigen